MMNSDTENKKKEKKKIFRWVTNKVSHKPVETGWRKSVEWQRNKRVDKEGGRPAEMRVENKQRGGTEEELMMNKYYIGIGQRKLGWRLKWIKEIDYKT